MAAIPIFFDPSSRHSEAAIRCSPDFRVVDDPDEADLLWMRRHYTPLFDELLPFQSLNHIRDEEVMCLKGHLTEMLLAREAAKPSTGFSHRDFYRESYLLYDLQDREAFLRQLPEEDSEENLWILKPVDKARGIGMRVMWQLDELREQLADTSSRSQTFDGEKYMYIAQRYIRDVFLLDERKSELRAWWLVASVDPLIVFVYPRGTVRISTEKYELGNYENTAIHLGNIYQQKKRVDFTPAAVDTWMWEDVERYVVQNYADAGANWLESHLLPRIDSILAHVSETVGPVLYKSLPNQGNFFGIYGADLIMDQSLNPWLTEIQLGPGLPRANPTKWALIPPMWQEAAKIVHEIAERKAARQSLEHLDSVEHYRCVVGPGVQAAACLN